RRANVHSIVATGRRPGLQKGKTMRAVGLFTHGGPEVLQVVELPEVHAGQGEVRIRVHAATVNPTDVMARNGARAEQQKADPPPYVPEWRRRESSTKSEAAFLTGSSLATPSS